MIKIKNLDYYYSINKKIDIRKIFKTTKEKVLVIDKINLNIEGGSRHAIIGFNGAGKSTLIKLLIGILKPASGQIEINGLDPWKDRILHVKNIGVVWGQRSTLWWDLPVRESFEAIKSIYNVGDEQFEKNINLLNEKLNFKAYWHQPVRKLSLGQRAKAEIVMALLHNPSTLFLDEPFLGLDFISRRAIVNALDELITEKNLTLILTSHNINDINDLCKTITVLKNGKVVLNTNINDFKKANTSLVQVIVEKDDFTELVIQSNKNLTVNKGTTNKNVYIINFCKDKVNVNEVIESVFKENTGIVGINIKEESLENLLKEILMHEKIGENKC